MDFDKLTADLERQDRTVRLAAAAIRMRAEYMRTHDYTPATVAIVRNVALWLESSEGKSAMLDASIGDVAP